MYPLYATCLWKVAKSVSGYAGFAMSFEICPAPAGAEVLKNSPPLFSWCGSESIGQCAKVMLAWGWAAACKPHWRLKARSLDGNGSWQKDWGRFLAPKPCTAPSQHDCAADRQLFPSACVLHPCVWPGEACSVRVKVSFFEVFVMFFGVKCPQEEVGGKGGDWFWSTHGWRQL